MVKHMIFIVLSWIGTVAGIFGVIFLIMAASGCGNQPQTVTETERMVIVSKTHAQLYPHSTTDFFVVQDQETKKKFLLVIHGGRPTIAPLGDDDGR